MTQLSDSYPRILVCKDPDNCDEEHNLWGKEDHHYGCECNGCQNYYYRKLK